jgi:hypothetical protein
MASKKKEQYYSLDNILSKGCQYNIIIGERSNGKTYATLKHCLQMYKDYGYQTAYIRRMTEDFRGKRGVELFTALSVNNEIEKIFGDEWNSIYFYSGRWFLCKYEETEKGKLEKTAQDNQPFMYAFALSAMEHDKGSGYPMIKQIVFDEFISRIGYITDEFMLYMNTLSTIIRQRNDVTIFMLANTVNKFCPYFAEMGLRHVRDMKQGTIDVYQMGNQGLRIAVEYCGGTKKVKKKSDLYFSFDNPKLQMITGGTWEIDIYPHCPYKYRPKDIIFTFFIIFDGEVLQCEVVSVDNNAFMFIHRKTTPLKDEDNDLIYSEKYDARPNWRRKITVPVLPIEHNLLEFFRAEKIFYQDNEVGEIIRNYLMWCGGTNEG